MSSVHRPPAPRVIIVGGGLAGLAAASQLVDRGLQITLLESRPRLGGRASSFVDPVTGELVDNCQHVSMACCTNLADFLARVGVAHLMRREPEIVFLDRAGRVSRFRAGILPAPLHLAESFLKARFLSPRDKLAIARGLAALARPLASPPGESFGEWLRRHGQTPRGIELFWTTILVSALNEELDRMDPGHARKVFLDGFLKNRGGFQPEIPLVPLGELYGARLEKWLAHHEVEIQLTTGARSIEVDDEGGLVGVTTRSGRLLPADFVILAVPFDRVGDLIPGTLRDRIWAVENAASLEASPITGVHLWFDRPICPFDHVVTPGRLIQWVFNHTAIQGRYAPGSPDSGQGQYLQIVVSASYGLLGLDKIAIRDRVLEDLADLWPEVKSAVLVRSWVVTEHGATFAVRPGVDYQRPRQRTAQDGLFLAGDWTATGWPATMEGAVRSGYQAAEGILQDLDQPTRLICPDPPTGRLARWLLS